MGPATKIPSWKGDGNGVRLAGRPLPEKWEAIAGEMGSSIWGR